MRLILIRHLALAVILQTYMGVSDDEVIEATIMDRRWQLVLDCLENRSDNHDRNGSCSFHSLAPQDTM